MRGWRVSVAAGLVGVPLALAGRKIGEITSDRQLDDLVRRYLGVRP